MHDDEWSPRAQKIRDSAKDVPEEQVELISEIERLEHQLESEQAWNLFALLDILFLSGLLIGLLVGLEARVWRGWRRHHV